MVDFENTPALSTGPSIYVAVPGPQTITTTPATFTGGVVLGFATFFPAISFATPPNVYGTADFGNGLPEKLTISVNPAFPTTEVSFALKNAKAAQSFQPSVGTKLPKGLSLHPLPQPLIADIKPLQPYAYVKFKDRVLIVNPMTRVIVDMFPQS